MASSSTNKTIWTLALVGIAVFLAWKLWPAIKKLLNNAGGGGPGGGGGPVGGASSPYPFQENPYTSGNSGSGLSAGFGNPNPGSPAISGSSDLGVWSAFDNWLQVVLSTGQDNADALNVDDTIANNGTDELAALDNSGLSTQPYQLFDVNQLAYSPDGSDGSSDYTDSGFGYGFGDTASVNGYDPSAYLDTVSVDGGLIDDGSGGNEGGDVGGNGDGGGFGY